MKRFPAFLLIPLVLASCGRATYPKERVAESLVQLCRNEYQMDVQAQMADTTLGVRVAIPGLVDELRKHAASASAANLIPAVLVEGRYQQKAFDFRIFTRGTFARVDEEERQRASGEGKREEPSEAMKKLQQVSTALHRVSLSTDAPLEFYSIIARDPGPDQLDVIFSGHVLDSKRVQFYAISIGELQSRSEVTVRYHPEVVARQAVQGFFLEMRRRPLAQILSRYTAPGTRFGEMLPKILAIAADLKGQEERLIGEEWPVLQMDRATALVYVPLASIGEPGAILFTVHLEESQGSFLDIERLVDGRLPARHLPLGDPKQWANTFYLEPLHLPTFLADQIKKRVAAQFIPMDPEATEKKSRLKPATTEEVTRALVETAAYVTTSYQFKDFQEITVIDGLEGTRWTVPSSDLPLYRSRSAPELKPIP